MVENIVLDKDLGVLSFLRKAFLWGSGGTTTGGSISTEKQVSSLKLNSHSKSSWEMDVIYILLHNFTKTVP